MAVLTVVAQVGDRFWRAFPKTGASIRPTVINQTASDYVVSNYGAVFDSIKNGVNFFFLLPIKIGSDKVRATGVVGV